MVWQGFRLIVDNTKVQAILVPGGMGRRRGAMASSTSRLGVVCLDRGPLFPFRHLSFSISIVFLGYYMV